MANRIVVVGGGGLGSLLGGAGVFRRTHGGGSKAHALFPVARVDHVLAISPKRLTTTHAVVLAVPITRYPRAFPGNEGLVLLLRVGPTTRPHTCGATAHAFSQHAPSGHRVHNLRALLFVGVVGAWHHGVHGHGLRRRRSLQVEPRH